MNVFIRHYNDEYHWFVTSGQAVSVEHFHGSLDDLANYYRLAETVKNWILIAPAIDTATRKIDFIQQEKSHIRKAIPYLLEEALLTDADDIHVVTDKPSNTSINVIAIDQKKLASWIEELKQADISPTHCLPETQLLKASSAQWLIVYTGDAYIFKTVDGECAAFEPDHFPLAIELISENFSVLPEAIELVAENDETIELAMKALPEALHHLVVTEKMDYANMVQQQFSSNAKVWDLLKGKFAQSRQWLLMFMPWRWVVIGFFAVFCLHITLVYSEYRQALNDYDAVRVAMDEVARQVIPQGNIVNHRQQIQKQLDSLMGRSGGEKFSLRLEKIGKVLAENDIGNMNSVNFDVDKNEIRLDFMVANYEKLNEIITGIKANGFNAEIQNSVAQDDELRARISVKG